MSQKTFVCHSLDLYNYNGFVVADDDGGSDEDDDIDILMKIMHHQYISEADAKNTLKQKCHPTR